MPALGRPQSVMELVQFSVCSGAVFIGIGAASRVLEVGGNGRSSGAHLVTSRWFSSMCLDLVDFPPMQAESSGIRDDSNGYELTARLKKNPFKYFPRAIPDSHP